MGELILLWHIMHAGAGMEDLKTDQIDNAENKIINEKVHAETNDTYQTQKLINYILNCSLSYYFNFYGIQ